MRGLRLWVGFAVLLWVVACKSPGGGNIVTNSGLKPIPAINASTVRGALSPARGFLQYRQPRPGRHHHSL